MCSTSTLIKSPLVEGRRRWQGIVVHRTVVLFVILQPRDDWFVIPLLGWRTRCFTLLLGGFAAVRSHWNLGSALIPIEILVVIKGMLVCWCNRAMVRKPSSWAHWWVLPVLNRDPLGLINCLLLDCRVLHYATVTKHPTAAPLGICSHLGWPSADSFLTLRSTPSHRFLSDRSGVSLRLLEFVDLVTLGIVDLSEILDFVLEHCDVLFEAGVSSLVSLVNLKLMLQLIIFGLHRLHLCL